MMRPYDDDDDFDDAPGGSIGQAVLRAVAIAALTTAATKLVDWGVDELRRKFGSPAPKLKEEIKEEPKPEV